MKLQPRERRPYVDYLVEHCADLKLGTLVLGWRNKKTGSKRRGRPSTVAKPDALDTAQKSKSVKPQPSAKKETAKSQKAKNGAKTSSAAKPKTVRKPKVAGTVPVNHNAATARRGRPPGRRNSTTTGGTNPEASAAITAIPSSAVTGQSAKPTTSTLFPNAHKVPHVVPTFRFLNGDKINCAVPLSVTVLDLRNAVRNMMIKQLAAEGHRVSAADVWVMLIVQGTDLRADKMKISDTTLSNSSVVHCLITPYTPGDVL